MKFRYICATIAATVSCGATFAQSSLTIFGVVDAAATSLSGSGRGNVSGLAAGSEGASRLGFRGVEDLGGSLYAGFWVEGQLQNATGVPNGLNFQRRSTVSLGRQDLGELRLGRDYTTVNPVVSGYDPFTTRGVGGSQGQGNFGFATVRSSNIVEYVAPAGRLNGFSGLIQYGFGGKVSGSPNAQQGDTYGLRIGYGNGTLSADAAFTRFKQVIGASDTASPPKIGKDLLVSAFGVAYDLHIIKPVLFYGQEKVEGGAIGTSQVDTLLLGAYVRLGRGTIKVAASRYDLKDSPNDWKKFAIGYVYPLSKRTRIYATAARLKNQGAASQSINTVEGLTSPGSVAGGSSAGYELGIGHSF